MNTFMYECLSKEQTLLMPLALAQGSNKAERLPALDTACKGRVEGASTSRISRSVVLNYTHPPSVSHATSFRASQIHLVFKFLPYQRLLPLYHPPRSPLSKW